MQPPPSDFHISGCLRGIESGQDEAKLRNVTGIQPASAALFLEPAKPAVADPFHHRGQCNPLRNWDGSVRPISLLVRMNSLFSIAGNHSL